MLDGLVQMGYSNKRSSCGALLLSPSNARGKKGQGMDRCPRCGYVINTLTKEKAKQIRDSYPKAFSPWTPEDDQKLIEMAENTRSIGEISKILGRQPSAIQKRLDLLRTRAQPVVVPEVNYLDRQTD